MKGMSELDLAFNPNNATPDGVDEVCGLSEKISENSSSFDGMGPSRSAITDATN
jgi:hypothetical protein